MKSRSVTRTVAIVALVFLASLGQVSGQQSGGPRYRLIDLGTLGGPNSTEGTQAPIVTDTGSVIGVADTSIPDPLCFSDCFIGHAFRWKKGILSDLGTLPGGSRSDAIWANRLGLIVGTSENGLINPLVGGPENRAVLWQKDGRIIDLGTLGGNDSSAFAINNHGQIVGGALNDIPDPFSFPGLATQARAFLWQNGVMQDLGTLGGPDAFSTSINDRGQIAGISMTDSTPNATTGFPTFHPFLWENGRMLDLGSLGGTQAVPAGGIDDATEGQRALNNRGQVAGGSTLDGDSTVHPFLWDGATLRDLGTLGGTFGVARAINDAGDVAGAASTANDEAVHAFFWRDGKMIDLGTVSGDSCSLTHFMNASSQIVGSSFDCADFVELHGFVWQPNGQMIDLNAFVPPESDLTITDGETINDSGEIAASGMLPNGDFHAIVLIPCDDEPDREGCQAAGQNKSRTSLARTSASQKRLSPTEMRVALTTRFARRYHVPSLGTPRQ
jgi:probable HAF family extracellular repeat protein